MAIIYLNFCNTYTPGIPSKILSLVSCEHPEHNGDRIRLVRKTNVQHADSGFICRSCSMLGELNHFYGKKHSAKTIEKIISKNRKLLTGELPKPIIKRNTKFQNLELLKLKMSLKSKGKKHTPEALAKMSLASKGRKMSSSARLKMSLSKRGKPGHKKSPESIEKSRQGILGSKHYAWNPNLTNEDREKRRKDRKYKDWCKNILAKFNYTCQLSGAKGGKLSAHHLDGWNKFKEKRYDIDNGICLTKRWHFEFHRDFKYGNNTKEQFFVWLSYDYQI